MWGQTGVRFTIRGTEPNRGRSIAAFPSGTLLQGQQTTADGTGMVYFSCDRKQTVFGSVYEGAGSNEAITARGWSPLNMTPTIC